MVRTVLLSTPACSLTKYTSRPAGSTPFRLMPFTLTPFRLMPFGMLLFRLMPFTLTPFMAAWTSDGGATRAAAVMVARTIFLSMGCLLFVFGPVSIIRHVQRVCPPDRARDVPEALSFLGAHLRTAGASPPCAGRARVTSEVQS